MNLLVFGRKSISVTSMDPNDEATVLRHIRELARSEALRVTRHAQEEMAEDEASLDEVLQAIQSGEILENYPEHRRGPCCLLGGYTTDGRALHVVCTTIQPILVIITVYEPKLPKWITPTRRGPIR